MAKIVFVTQRRSGGQDPRTRALEAQGHKVTELRNSLQCMETMANNPPNLLLLDVLIEGRNGFDVTRQVRALYPAEQVPIILCSDVYRGRLFREEAMNAGAQRFLLTPIDMEELLKDVKTLTYAASKSQENETRVA
jgi:twitching motility two-component system response regulator PilH